MHIRNKLKLVGGELLLGGLWVFRGLSGPRPLRRAYTSLLKRLLTRVGLFDEEFYLETNDDVARSNRRPLAHYVQWGDREGRRPMAFFEPSYYRAHARSRTARVNALLHYAYVGRYRGISPSPWFDVRYYLQHNKDVARAGIDPLLHFLKWGGREERSPSPNFDTAWYLRSNPEVEQTGMNPLLHYLLYGRVQGRAVLPVDEYEGMSALVSPPDELCWETLVPRSAIDGAKVDVIVPVYRGRTETLRCLHRALSAVTEIPFELVVIDDDSPEPELAADLQRFAERGLFTLLRNEVNRGFVHSVNRGMALHADRDVVLLNADAEVYDRWLDRLFHTAREHPRTATVTPLSNNATICSYPRTLHDNPFPLECSYAELDALAAEVNAGEVVEAPTGVGFCMYISRAALDDVGLFDEATFGKGYGEENDFCQRGIARGWRHLLAADVFVHHWGSASFRGERVKRVQKATKLLDRRHPTYQASVARFIEQDPLAAARKRLDWARLRRARRERNVLIVCHNRGGGTERHVQEDIQYLDRAGYGVFVLRPAPGQPTHALLSHPAMRSLPNLELIPLAKPWALIRACKELEITELHSHSLVDFVPDAPEYLIALVDALGVEWDINLHDYKVICPRINLADEDGRYCGEPDEFACNRCLAERGAVIPATDIHAWRAMHSTVLRRASRVLVPDEDVATRLQRYFAGVKFEVSPHEVIDCEAKVPREIRVAPGEPLRVVVIGAIGKLKGFDVLCRCAEDAKKRGLPIEFTVMGYSLNDRLLSGYGVHITGKYHEHDAAGLLEQLNPHLVWLPSLWPETYSYTLSLALEANLPVMAFDIGAIAARLRRLERDDLVLPLSLSDHHGELNSFLLRVAGLLEAPSARAVSL